MKTVHYDLRFLLFFGISVAVTLNACRPAFNGSSVASSERNTKNSFLPAYPKIYKVKGKMFHDSVKDKYFDIKEPQFMENNPPNTYRNAQLFFEF